MAVILKHVLSVEGKITRSKGRETKAVWFEAKNISHACRAHLNSTSVKTWLCALDWWHQNGCRMISNQPPISLINSNILSNWLWNTYCILKTCIKYNQERRSNCNVFSSFLTCKKSYTNNTLFLNLLFSLNTVVLNQFFCWHQVVLLFIIGHRITHERQQRFGMIYWHIQTVHTVDISYYMLSTAHQSHYKK